VIRLRVEGARAEEHAAAPMVTFTLAIEEEAARAVQSVLLQTLVRVEPSRRRAPAKGDAGTSGRWGTARAPLVWAEVTRVVPAFDRACAVDLAVPCSYDLDIAATTYLHAADEGDVALSFLFRGTVFYRGEAGMRVEMLPWDREAAFALPIATWRAAFDAFFPNQGWLRLDRGVLDALLAYKAARAHASWDDVMRDLLGAHARAGAAS
jgi:hypothetical protein